MPPRLRFPKSSSSGNPAFSVGVRIIKKILERKVDPIPTDLLKYEAFKEILHGKVNSSDEFVGVISREEEQFLSMFHEVTNWMASRNIIERYVFEDTDCNKYYWGQIGSKSAEFRPMTDEQVSKMLLDLEEETDYVYAFENRPGEPESESVEKSEPTQVTPVTKTQDNTIVTNRINNLDIEVTKLRGTSIRHDSQLEKLQQENEELQKKIKSLQSIQRVEFEIIYQGKKEVIKQTVHEKFAEVLFHIKVGDNVMLVGPSGCGKTELAHQMAKQLKREFGMLSLSGGVTEVKLLGRNPPNINTGKAEYQTTQFVKFCEVGGLFLLDEVDAGDPNVLLSLNSLLSNKWFYVDRLKNPRIDLHKNFICMAAANTWGHGADRQYVGRNQMDSAFTKRFVQIEMDYDKALEFALCPGQNEFVEKMHLYRQRIREARLERVLDTRFILRAYNWLKYGKDFDYCENKLFAGWRADEVRKVRVA